MMRMRLNFNCNCFKSYSLNAEAFQAVCTVIQTYELLLLLRLSLLLDSGSVLNYNYNPAAISGCGIQRQMQKNL